MRQLFFLQKLLFLFGLCVFFASVCNSQTNQWTWMKGDSTANNEGVYGVKGVPSVYNNPEARSSSATWTDAQGNFWLFGGDANSLYTLRLLNDMWKYTPSTNEWTWVSGDTVPNQPPVYGVKGMPSSINNPSGRYSAATWTDAGGNFWLFGGELAGHVANDLWKYDVQTNEWVWIAGDSTGNSFGLFGTKGVAGNDTHPPAAVSPASWTDKAGDLWMFGGQGSQGYFNCLWKYTIRTNQWTWMKGDSTGNSMGVSGTQGVSSPANTPCPRGYGVSWVDTAGHLWLFGGEGFAGANYAFPYFQDVWKYDIATNEWTWVKGDPQSDVNTNYGTIGISSPLNKPGGRRDCVVWKDSAEKVWIFGGYVWRGHLRQDEVYNDLWQYNMLTNEWIWVNGDNTTDKLGRYNTQGIASPFNQIGSRYRSAAWQDSSQNFWIFGGVGTVPYPQPQFLNDLWRYSSANVVLLPVTLTSFTAALHIDKVSLQWSAQNEQNFDHYEVERSLNGSKYLQLVAVKAANSSHYNYVDNADELRGRKVYYRLRIVDKDGKFSYSSVVVLQIPFNAAFTVYPNPASANFYLQLNKSINGRVNVEVTDVSGKVMMRKAFDVDGSVITISAGKLAAGTYLVKMIYKDEQYWQKVVMK